MDIKTLSDICNYRKETLPSNKCDRMTFISTENMLPNKAGVVISAKCPTSGNVSKYYPGDVLVSNIRPYFKKIYLADKEGACSNDVLVFFPKREVCTSDFLFCLLSTDAFFAHATKTAKGTKMPRGDRSAIMGYQINWVPINEQSGISEPILNVYRKIKLNEKINDNLLEQCACKFQEMFVCNSQAPTWPDSSLLNLIEKTISGDWGKEQPTGMYTEKVLCVRGADIPDLKKGKKGKTPTRYILAKNCSTKKLNCDDIIVEISGGSPTQSTGRTVLVSDALISQHGNVICTNFCRALRPKKDYSFYIYYYLEHLYKKGIMFSYENGTTGIKNLDLSSFLKKENIKLPPIEEVMKFSNFAKKCHKLINQNGLENEALQIIRDNLLRMAFLPKS